MPCMVIPGSKLIVTMWRGEMPAMPCVVLSWINAAHCSWIEVGCSNFLEDCKIFTAAALAYFLTATTFSSCGELPTSHIALVQTRFAANITWIANSAASMSKEVHKHRKFTSWEDHSSCSVSWHTRFVDSLACEIDEVNFQSAL